MTDVALDSFSEAERCLLAPYGLSMRDLESTLAGIMARGADDADLYCQYSRAESWSLDEGIVKAGSFGIDQGFGARAVTGEKTAYAYSDDIGQAALEAVAAHVRAITSAGQEGSFPVCLQAQPSPARLYATADPIALLPAAEKVRLLERLEAFARAEDSRVVQVMASLAGEWETVLMACADGHLAADIRPLARVSIAVIVEANGQREQGSAGGGGRFGYDYFDDDRLREYARQAVRQATLNLEARPAPAGKMTVVLGPGWPGILLHEAVGHGLEGDFNRKGSSAFSGRLGERVAASGVTVVDNGRLPDRRGSLTVDDEGTPTHETVLIENGILKGYLQDRLNARLMGTQSTGNGRRESFAAPPLPRMTNTYMLAGQRAPEEILRSVEKGIYAVNFGGGQVDITSGKFVFSMSEAYLIEQGRPTAPIKGATLIGNGPDILMRVAMIGNDLALDPGVGSCGKEGQNVPVGVGLPTLRLDGITVGGTQNATMA
ncbi:MAG: metalloprotease TldD [Zoogloeaceae bacterium]|jgi:TldD protein|nr:metalloprotease TldD [Zoogloeaceae bacterium]